MVRYLKWETYSGPISFEVQRNDIWTCISQKKRKYVKYFLCVRPREPFLGSRNYFFESNILLKMCHILTDCHKCTFKNYVSPKNWNFKVLFIHFQLSKDILEMKLTLLISTFLLIIFLIYHQIFSWLLTLHIFCWKSLIVKQHIHK